MMPVQNKSMLVSGSPAQVISDHQARGRYFYVDGVRSFVLDEGSGDPVVCLHGVPVSSLIYGNLVSELAGLGHRAVAFDFPGMGLAERPKSFDYSWSGLAGWTQQAVDALGLDRFHLVVHDIGGPVGFHLVKQLGSRIKSLTVLNTPIKVASFRRPLPMKAFAAQLPLVGKIALKINQPALYLASMRRLGFARNDQVSSEFILANRELLLREDGGNAFLKIMRGFELNQATETDFMTTLADQSVAKQIVWGDLDPALKVRKHGQFARQAMPSAPFATVSGKHFFQWDCAADLVPLISNFAAENASSH